MTHRVLAETKVGGKQVRPGDLAAPSQRELLAAPWCFEAADQASAAAEPPPPDLFQRLREQDRQREAQDGENREATRRRMAQQLFQQGLAALGHGWADLKEHADQLVAMSLAAIEADRREREERAEYERAFVPPGEEGIGTADVVADPPKPERRGRRGAAQE